DADDHDVGADLGAVAELNAVGSAAGAGDVVELDPEPQVDAVVAVQVGEHPGDLGTEDPKQREFAHLDDRDFGTGGSRGGGRLQADPAGADHHDPAGAGEGRLQLVGVTGGAQVVHPGLVRTGNLQAARQRTGGEQELGVFDPAAVGEYHLVRAAIDRRDRRAEPQVDVVLPVPVR